MAGIGQGLNFSQFSERIHHISSRFDMNDAAIEKYHLPEALGTTLRELRGTDGIFTDSDANLKAVWATLQGLAAAPTANTPGRAPIPDLPKGKSGVQLQPDGKLSGPVIHALIGLFIETL